MHLLVSKRQRLLLLFGQKPLIRYSCLTANRAISVRVLFDHLITRRHVINLSLSIHASCPILTTISTFVIVKHAYDAV